jgi:selenocysteine-specific elongation factor
VGISTLIGVIGHVDHGKTALVRALTGQDTDRLPEEKRRGISIALGFAHLPVLTAAAAAASAGVAARAASAGAVGADIDLIDMPGHERFIRTMVSGATGIDAVLLVVAANEGVKPQTIEHVNIAGLLGLRRAVVAVSKADLVAPAQARRVADDATRLLVQSGLEPLPPVLTSASEASGIDDLRGALQGLTDIQPARNVDGSIYLPIDRAFSIAGHGPVVTGTLRGGCVSIGDTLELLPSRRSVRVRAIQVHGARVDTATPGQRVALNLRDIEIADLGRGMAVAALDTLDLSKWLTISVRAVEGSPPLKNGMGLRVLLGTGEHDARLRLLDRDVLEAGQTGFAQLHFAEEQVAVPAREHVVLRLLSPSQTVAGGKVLETGARRKRRRDPQLLQRLLELQALTPAAIVVAEVQRAALAGTTLRHLARISALTPTNVAALLRARPVLVARSGTVVWRADMDALLARIPELLTIRADVASPTNVVPQAKGRPPARGLTEAAGLNPSQLLAMVPGTAAPVLEVALTHLRSRGIITERGGHLSLPRPPDAARARLRIESDRGLRIAEALRQGGLNPPSPSAIVTDPQSKRAVDRLLLAGMVVRAIDRAKGREILFHQDAINDAQRLLAPLLDRPPGLLVTEVGEALGISRKYSMPLLAYLDAIRFTVRVADRRVRATSAPRRSGSP